MRLSVNQGRLAEAIGMVRRAVATRTTLPILSNILLSAEEGGELRLAATNGEIGITCWISAKVENVGAITVPAKLLNEFVNSLPNQPIQMGLVERTQTLHLECDRNNAGIKGIDYNDFPALPGLEDHDRLRLSAGELVAMIKSVVVAASEDQNRPTLTGVEITIDATNVAMVATDGYRLGYRRHDSNVNTDKVAVIVPHKALELLGAFLKDGQVEVAITEDRDMILFGWEGVTYKRMEMSCQLIDARFPDWTATVPKEPSTVATMPIDELQRAVKCALLFGSGNANTVRFTCDGDEVTVAASSGDGETTSTLPCTVDGPPISIAFNGRYVLDVLAILPDSNVVMELTQATHPGLFRAGNMKKDDGYAVIMPMHPPR